jgi:hypothetical protein
MDISSFILLACLIGNGNLECIKQMELCVNGKRSEVIKSQLATKTDKSAAAEELIMAPPAGDWSHWILQCSKEIKK